MGYFERNQWILERSGDDKQVDKKPVENKQVEVQEQKQRRLSRYLPYILISFFIVIILAGLTYLFGSSAKDVGSMNVLSTIFGPSVSLTATIYSEDNPMAIVNGEMVHEGDMVGDVKVVKIHKASVDFEMAEKKWSQDLPVVEEGVRFSGSDVSNLPVLLVLGSGGCPACREQMPVLDVLRSKYGKKFIVKYIDVHQNRAMGEKYGIRAIPTLIFLNSKGQEVFRHVGFYPEAEIVAAWNNNGVKL